MPGSQAWATDARASLHAAAAALTWLPAGSLSIYAKYQYLTVGPASVRIISKVVGRDSEFDITFVEWMSFFSADILLHFFVIPLLIFLLVWSLRLRAVVVVIPFLTAAVIITTFFNMLAYANIGRFLDIDLVTDAIRWSGKNEEATDDYISTTAIYKLAALVLASFLPAAVPFFLERRGRVAEIARRLLPAAVAACGLAGLVFWALGASAGIISLPQHQAYMMLMTRALFDQPADAVVEKMSLAEAMEFFQKTTGTPPPVADARYYGTHRDSDVIYFVFETGPYKAAPLHGDLKDFPTIRNLAERGFVGLRHHSSYPYTTPALMTLFSGMYPWEGFRHSLRNNPRAMATGALHSLAAAGYETAVYAPTVPELELDDIMFHALGAKKQFFANEWPATAKAVERTRALMATFPARPEVLTTKLDSASRIGTLRLEKTVEERLLRDIDALEQMKADIRRLKQEGKRFAAVLIPQLGHGPWRDIFNQGDDFLARGRAIMAVQDAWIGEIVELLKSGGWLDDTVIVVTADHGVRNRTEDPKFPQGMIDAYSFHVPLVIHAPRAVSSTVTMDHITSHIDVTPTVLDLLGISLGRQFEQGRPLWDFRLADRTVYFMAAGLLGADGFYRGGQFYMYNVLTGAVYRSPEMRFSTRDLVNAADPDYGMARTVVDTMSLITRRWSTIVDEHHP